MQVPGVKVAYECSYQNNRDWAISNKSKGSVASWLSLGSTVSGVVKVYSSSNKDSRVYRVSNFLEKVFYAVSNCLQYYLFGRRDDVLGDDKEKRPFAAKVGRTATFQEKYVNPIAKPALVLFDANQQEGLNDALSFLDSFYWKIRFALGKIRLEDIKFIPKMIRRLFQSEINADDKDKTTQMIGEIIAPIFGWIGTFCVGIFNPLKTVLKFFDVENKAVNFLAYTGKAAINIPYFFKFTLPMLWKGLITKDKKFYSAFAVGSASNVLNIGLPLVELLPTGSIVKEMVSKVYKSLAANLSMLFFPLRRNCLGSDWLNNHK